MIPVRLQSGSCHFNVIIIWSPDNEDGLLAVSVSSASCFLCRFQIFTAKCSGGTTSVGRSENNWRSNNQKDVHIITMKNPQVVGHRATMKSSNFQTDKHNARFRLGELQMIVCTTWQQLWGQFGDRNLLPTPVESRLHWWMYNVGNYKFTYSNAVCTQWTQITTNGIIQINCDLSWYTPIKSYPK